MLYKLFVHHKDNISDGYYSTTLKNYGCILNPDKTLVNMELRMKNFLEYWSPNFKMLCGAHPNYEEWSKIVKNNQLYM